MKPKVDSEKRRLGVDPNTMALTPKSLFGKKMASSLILREESEVILRGEISGEEMEKLE